MHYGGLSQRHWFLVPQVESMKSSLNQPALGTLAPCCCHSKFLVFFFFLLAFYFESILRLNKKVTLTSKVISESCLLSFTQLPPVLTPCTL